MSFATDTVIHTGSEYRPTAKDPETEMRGDIWVSDSLWAKIDNSVCTRRSSKSCESDLRRSTSCDFDSGSETYLTGRKPQMFGGVAA